MRIDIAMGFFLPIPPVSDGAMEKTWFWLDREFMDAGHSVTVLSRCWPGFPVRENREGTEMIRVPGWSHTRSDPLNLLLDGLCTPPAGSSPARLPPFDPNEPLH